MKAKLVPVAMLGMAWITDEEDGRQHKAVIQGIHLIPKTRFEVGLWVRGFYLNNPTEPFKWTEVTGRFCADAKLKKQLDAAFTEQGNHHILRKAHVAKRIQDMETRFRLAQTRTTTKAIHAGK